MIDAKIQDIQNHLAKYWERLRREREQFAEFDPQRVEQLTESTRRMIEFLEAQISEGSAI